MAPKHTSPKTKHTTPKTHRSAHSTADSASDSVSPDRSVSVSPDRSVRIPRSQCPYPPMSASSVSPDCSVRIPRLQRPPSPLYTLRRLLLLGCQHPAENSWFRRVRVLVVCTCVSLCVYTPLIYTSRRGCPHVASPTPRRTARADELASRSHQLASRFRLSSLCVHAWFPQPPDLGYPSGSWRTDYIYGSWRTGYMVPSAPTLCVLWRTNSMRTLAHRLYGSWRTDSMVPGALAIWFLAHQLYAYFGAPTL
ncbi:hypothetical protein BJ138DRAFT_211399 [Hygrophoropsis aurantiaca]|uniref:Uncharacterized protein n=1 Tax=Hygrophoropsis aurantiaca TaxID=72124 RepID=A0ACB7ZRX4_9AGAM|nr:hypothetical protein BJ138DRAFT_211399 [Hygrophoropsis aurantiaca]